MVLNLHKKLYKVGYNNDMPFVWLTQQRQIGIEVKFIRTIAEMYNFTLDFENWTGQYGAKLPNGSWSGIIGAVASNRIDFGIGGLSLTYERTKVVDFLYPHYFDSMTFATKPPKMATDLDIMLKPFDLQVWALLLCAFVLLFLFTFVRQFFQRTMIDRLNKFKKSKKKIMMMIAKDENLKILQKNPNHNIGWIALHILLRQPYPWFLTMNISAKIFIMIWAFSSLILSTTYGGCLFSTLLNPDYIVLDSIEKLAQACQSGEIIPISSEGSSVISNLKESEVPSFRLVTTGMISGPNTTEIMNIVLNKSDERNYAAITSRERLEFAQLISGDQNLYLPPKTEKATFFSTYCSIPFIKSSFPYIREFNLIVSRFSCSGLLTQWKTDEVLRIRIIKSKQVIVNDEPDGQTVEKDVENNDDSFLKFTIKHFSSILITYLTLLFTSVLILIFEVSVRIKLKRSNPIIQ